VKKVLMILFAATFICLISMAAYAQTINVRFAHGSPRNHPNYVQADDFAEEILKATNGRLKITVYGDRQLGDDNAILQLVRAGTVDAGFCNTVNFQLVLNKIAFEGLNLPFLIKSYEDEAKLLNSEVGMKFLNNLDDAGIKGLVWTEGGFRHFLYREGIIKKFENFKGIKMRIVPIPVFKAIWEAIGVNPVGVPYAEVYTALQTRVIDAVEYSTLTTEADNVWEVAKYMTLTGHYFVPTVFFWSKKKFDELPADIQKIVMDTSARIRTKYILHTRDEDKAAVERLRKHGMTIDAFPDQERQKMIKATQPIVDEWSKKDPLIAEFVKAAKKF
jgi:TRAP-type transport system periplasmic protein